MASKPVGCRQERDVILLTILSGVFIGLAAATKINLALVGVVLPLGLWAATQSFKKLLGGCILAGFIALLVFRIGQPYAFEGPGFWGLQLNEKWTANLAEIRRLSVATVGFPPAVQWVDRNAFFGPWNALLWGLGLPLGVLVVFSVIHSTFFGLVARDFKKIIVVVWSIIGILVFSLLPNNATLRYLLPVYPAFFILSASAVCEVWNRGIRPFPLWIPRLLGAALIAGGAFWGIALSSIYVRPHSRVAASEWIVDNIPGAVSLEGLSESGLKRLPVPLRKEGLLAPGADLVLEFGLSENFSLEGVLLPKLEFEGEAPPQFHIQIEDGGRVIVKGEARASLTEKSFVLSFPERLSLRPNNLFRLRISNTGEIAATVRHYRIAHETDWDDGLPLRIRGLDPYGGMYEGSEKLEMYWEDNKDKEDRLARALKEADFIFMTSNRQWGSVGRLSEKFPISNKFYRDLAGCSASQSVPECYERLEVGPRASGLGFRLIKSVTSYPTWLGFEIPDQAAEEAFTVYDHPKVLLFAKTR